MDLIRASVLFTTVLHCVLAASLSGKSLPQASGPYSVKSTSLGILEVPSLEKDSMTDATIFYKHPKPVAEENKMAFKTYHDLEEGKTKNKQHLPSGTLETGPTYPLSTPKVKLNFVGTSGMLPVKIHTSPLDETKPAKAPKPTTSHKSAKPKKDEVDFMKFIRDLFFKPTEYAKQKVMPQEYLSTSVAGDKEVSLNNYKNHYKFQSSDSSGWNSGILLNPINIHQVGHNQYTSTYKPDAVDALQPTNVNYPTYPGYQYVPERAYQYTPYEPEALSKQHNSYKKEDEHHEVVTQSIRYKEKQQVHVAKPPIEANNPTKIVIKKKLPPVPTSQTPRQRIELTLLNSVAGLPGGNTDILDTIRL